MSKKLKHRFVVGYLRERNVIYGKDDRGQVTYTEPFTEFQARRYMRHLTSPTTKAIYELIPVKVIR